MNGYSLHHHTHQPQQQQIPISSIHHPKSPLLTQPSAIALSPTRFTNSLSFLPNSPRTLSSSPSSPFSPQFNHVMSSSPSPFFAPTIGFVDDLQNGDEDEEDEDDDDDGVTFNDPAAGLIVIDDNYDDTIFDPFEYREIDLKNQNQIESELLNQQKLQQQQLEQQQSKLEPQQQQQQQLDLQQDEVENLESNNNSTISSTTTTSTTSNEEPKKPLSYLEALKLNIPPDYYISYETKNTSQNSSNSSNSNHNGSNGKPEAFCHFYIQGMCRNGDNCKFVHGNLCEICNKPLLHPNNKEQNEEHMTECLINQEKLSQREQMKNFECGICFDSIVEKGRKFGLLSHCNHVFCLECIREWRGTTTTTTVNGQVVTTIQNSTSVRLCPMCRVNSHFIIPADIFVSDEKKQEIIEIYKSKLSTIPCKYFKGAGSCKFGTSCMYAHLNPDGSVYKPVVRKVLTHLGESILYPNQLGMFIPQNYNRNDEDEDDEEEYEYDEEEDEQENHGHTKFRFYNDD
eukprot:gene5289-6585_t